MESLQQLDWFHIKYTPQNARNNRNNSNHKTNAYTSDTETCLSS